MLTPIKVSLLEASEIVPLMVNFSCEKEIDVNREKTKMRHLNLKSIVIDDVLIDSPVRWRSFD